jgi:tetratricopeptide (TPR) repeat protein
MDAAKLLKQATAHHQAGRLGPAQALYRQVLAADPNHADALHLLGVLAHQTGHASQAEALIRQAIARAPRAHPFHTSLGHVLRAQNRPADAEAAYRTALHANPNAAENHHNLGMALREQGRAAAAQTAFRQALRLHRDFVAARIDLGNLLVEAGRPTEAEACLRAALRVAPTNHLVLNTLGLALVAQGKHQPALAMIEQALAAAPFYPSATVNRANTLVSLEQLDAAAGAFADAVRLVPDDLSLRLAQARLELRQGHATQAESLLRDILQRAAGHPPALHELARVHAAQDRPDLALPLLEHVCRLMPENAAAWRELGLAYRDLARWPDALAPLAEAARLRPDDAGMRSDYAYALLANGQFAVAWPEFRWRTKRPGNVRLGQPEWDGAPTGKTVIVHAEQGSGDTLQFCRFIPQAARLARVVVACPPSLKRLLQTLSPNWPTANPRRPSTSIVR